MDVAAVVYVDKRIVVESSLKTALLIRHHNTNITDSVGISQFVAVDPDTDIRYAVSDPRKGGVPAAQ